MLRRLQFAVKRRGFVPALLLLLRQSVRQRPHVLQRTVLVMCATRARCRRRIGARRPPCAAAPLGGRTPGAHNTAGTLPVFQHPLVLPPQLLVRLLLCGGVVPHALQLVVQVLVFLLRRLQLFHGIHGPRGSPRSGTHRCFQPVLQ